MTNGTLDKNNPSVDLAIRAVYMHLRGNETNNAKSLSECCYAVVDEAVLELNSNRTFGEIIKIRDMLYLQVYEFANLNPDIHKEAKKEIEMYHDIIGKVTS